MDQKVKDFFGKHPDATEVHEALGVLFSEKEAAGKYLGGVNGHTVTTHTPEGIEPKKLASEATKEAIRVKDAQVNDLLTSYEKAEPAQKEAIMKEITEGKADIKALEKTLAKQLKDEAKSN